MRRVGPRWCCRGLLIITPVPWGNAEVPETLVADEVAFHRGVLVSPHLQGYDALETVDRNPLTTLPSYEVQPDASAPASAFS